MRRYNADLANDLGNLLNRTVSMSGRYLDGRLPPVADATEPADLELRDAATRTVDGLPRRDGAPSARRGAGRRDAASRGAANGYAEGQAPWSLNKAGETERVGQVLAVMAEACRLLGHLLAPVAPAGARAMHEQLGAPAAYDERGAGGPGLERPPGVGRRPAVGMATGAREPDLPAHRGGGAGLSRRSRPARLPGLVDSHCHLQHERFDADRDGVLERAVEAGIERILVPGWDLASSAAALELAARHAPLVKAAVGVHPHSRRAD